MKSFPYPLNNLLSLFSGRGAREGYLAAVDQGAISAANFLATVILARQVSPTELGIYGVGFTCLRLVRAVQDGLTIQPLNTFGAAMSVEEFREYVTGTTLIQLSLALGSAAIAAGLGWIATRRGNDTAGPALFALWFAFLFWQLQEYIRRILYTRGKVLNAVVNTGLANGFRLALMLWWGRQGGLSGVAGLNAIAWGSLLALLPGIWQTRAYWTWLAPQPTPQLMPEREATLSSTLMFRRFSNIKEVWKRNWTFGRWVLGGSLANWVSVEFYPVLTAGMISFAAAGAYRALQNLVAPIHLLLRATDTFLTPRAARAFDSLGQAALERNLRLTYLILGIPILGTLGIAMLFPGPILHLLYGDTYLPYQGGVVLMALFYALWFAYWPLQTALKAARHTRPIFVGNLAAFVAMFTLGIWAIYRWGVYGTIAGQALNALVLTVIHWAAWIRIDRRVKKLEPG